MASIDLGGRLYLNLVSDDSVACSFSLNSVELDPVVNVSSRPNALGQFRMITTPGKQQVAKAQLNFCTDDEQAFLAQYQGVPVWVRALGVKFAGFYTDSTFTPRPMGNSWAVPLTFTQVTLSDLL